VKRVLIVVATEREIVPFVQFLKEEKAKIRNSLFGENGYAFDILVTGVGLVNTAFQLGKNLATRKYDMALNVGVAGAYNSKIEMGEIVEIVSEQYADFGAEEADGGFLDIFQMKLIDGNAPPFSNNKLINKKPLKSPGVKLVQGISVQTVRGYDKTIDRTRRKFNPDVESMEGCAFFQACLETNTPFAEIRAISNYVTPRDTSTWQMKDAIISMNVWLIEQFHTRAI
jgi:futalosine hydrolase